MKTLNLSQKRGFSKLWMLRRLNIFGAKNSELVDIYKKQVRSILEFASPVWASGITKENSKQIERVQRCALAIILGTDYISYKNGLSILKIERLTIRRKNVHKKQLNTQNTNIGSLLIKIKLILEAIKMILV